MIPSFACRNACLYASMLNEHLEDMHHCLAHKHADIHHSWGCAHNNAQLHNWAFGCFSAFWFFKDLHTYFRANTIAAFPVLKRWHAGVFVYFSSRIDHMELQTKNRTHASETLVTCVDDDAFHATASQDPDTFKNLASLIWLRSSSMSFHGCGSESPFIRN